MPIPFFVIEILEQSLINRAVSKLQNRTDVCAKKTTVAIPVAIVRHALPSLRWEKPLPIEDKKGIPVRCFLCNRFFFGIDIGTKLIKYVEPEPVIKVEEEDFAVEFNSPQHSTAFIDYLDLTVDDSPTCVPSTSSHMSIAEVIDLTLDN